MTSDLALVPREPATEFLEQFIGQGLEGWDDTHSEELRAAVLKEWQELIASPPHLGKLWENYQELRRAAEVVSISHQCTIMVAENFNDARSPMYEKKLSCECGLCKALRKLEATDQ